MKLVSNDNELYHYNPYHDKNGRFAKEANAKMVQGVNRMKSSSFLNRRKTQFYLRDISNTNASLEYRREKLQDERYKLENKKDSISKDKKLARNKLAMSQNSAAMKETAKMRDKILKKAQTLGMDVKIRKNRNNFTAPLWNAAYTEPANKGKETIKFILGSAIGTSDIPRYLHVGVDKYKVRKKK